MAKVKHELSSHDKLMKWLVKNGACPDGREWVRAQHAKIGINNLFDLITALANAKQYYWLRWLLQECVITLVQAGHFKKRGVIPGAFRDVVSFHSTLLVILNSYLNDRECSRVLTKIDYVGALLRLARSGACHPTSTELGLVQRQISAIK